jgi:hypothetical protein
MLLNVVVGIAGAGLGGWFLSPLVGVSTINQSNFSAAPWSSRLWEQSACWPSSTSRGEAHHGSAS